MKHARLIVLALLIGVILNVALCWGFALDQVSFNLRRSVASRLMLTSPTEPMWVCEVTESWRFTEVNSHVGSSEWEMPEWLLGRADDLHYDPPAWSRPSRLSPAEWRKIRESFFPRSSSTILEKEIFERAPGIKRQDFYGSQSEIAYGFPMRSMVATNVADEWAQGIIAPGQLTFRTRSAYIPLRILPLGFAVNSAIGAGLVVLAVLAGRRIRLMIARHRGRCPSCGYNIANLPSHICPECGAAWCSAATS